MKYGFVYIWYDKKRKMFYIGSHWGTEDDGYICSSNRMRNVYRRRPQDFKRKIISKITTNRNDLLNKEYEWLSLIESNELGIKYYNLTSHRNGHWSTEEERRLSLKEKISIKTKEAMNTPEMKEKMKVAYAKRDNTQSEETRKRRSESMKKTMAKKFPVENRYKPPTKEEYLEKLSEGSKRMWSNRSEQKKKEIGNKISISLKGKPRYDVREMKWWNNGLKSTRSKDCPGNEWRLGRA